MPFGPVIHLRPFPDERFITSSRSQRSYHWSSVDQSALFLSQVFSVPAPPAFAGRLDHCGSDTINKGEMEVREAESPFA
jgi:hypothetical protein